MSVTRQFISKAKPVSRGPMGEDVIVMTALPPVSVEELRTNRAKILDAIAENKACRRVGVTEGLYELSQCVEFSRMGHSLPMIRKVEHAYGAGVGNEHHNHDGRKAPEFQRAADDDEFRERLTRAAPWFKDFDLFGNGFRLAGGAVSAILMKSDDERHPGSLHDFDLFLVGHKNDETARAAIEELRRHLTDFWVDREITVYRSKGCITFHCKRTANECQDHLVQVVLRRYNTEAEIIHGFDLGSSAMLWDGHHVRMTALGKLAAEHGLNVLDFDVRRGSYESRLARYFGRGFDLVLPGLDGHKFLADDGRLPYIKFHGVRASCPCCISALGATGTRPGFDDDGRAPDPARVRAAETAASAAQPQQQPSFASSKFASKTSSISASATATDAKPKSAEVDPNAPAEASDYSVCQAYGNRAAQFRQNVRALGGEKVYVASLIAHAKLKRGTDIFSLQPTIDPEEMTNTVLYAFRGESVRIKLLHNLLGPEPTAELMLSYISGGGVVPTREVVKLICAERCVQLNKRATIPLEFMGVEENTALVGPFSRQVLSAAEWFGNVAL
jgi:hypothetical protein